MEKFLGFWPKRIFHAKKGGCKVVLLLLIFLGVLCLAGAVSLAAGLLVITVKALPIIIIIVLIILLILILIAILK